MRSFGAIAALAVLTTAHAFAGTQCLPAPAVAGALNTGFRQMYNLDFAAAHQTFRAWQQVQPQDPMGFVADAAAYLFAELDRLHVLESDLFTDDEKFQRRGKLTPDPAVKTEFEHALARADGLAQTILARSPVDPEAELAVVLANGLRGDYAALIEKRNFAALRYMKSSRALAEKLLAADPGCYDAYLAVGVENYLLGINPAPMRWLLHLGGAQTDKQQGLDRLRLAAQHGFLLAPYARLLLAVAALRDKDQVTARELLEGLAREFPHNRLYTRELVRLAQK